MDEHQTGWCVYSVDGSRHKRVRLGRGTARCRRGGDGTRGKVSRNAGEIQGVAARCRKTVLYCTDAPKVDAYVLQLVLKFLLRCCVVQQLQVSPTEEMVDVVTWNH